MTRINVIPGNLLLDQHLQAEVNEIPRVAPLAKKYWIRNWNKTNRDPLPPNYTLGEGHVMFFYDKGLYIRTRSLDLDELIDKRGLPFRPSYSRLFEDYLDITSNKGEIQSVDNKWTPTKEAIRINVERILYRISLRPFFYKMNGVNLNEETYEEYKTLLRSLCE
jgi:deoxyribonuclease (pyrimidine dimer)